MGRHDDGPPLLSQILFADHSVGAHAAFAAAAALAERERTGRGRLIQMNMLDVMTTYLGHHIPMMGLWDLAPTRASTRAGTRFVHLFEVREGNLFVAAISIGMWRGYAEFVGHPEWAPRGMAEVPDLRADPALREAAIMAGQERLGSMTAHDAMAALQGRGVTCGVMRTARQVYDEERERGSGAIHQVRYPDGTTVPVPGLAIDTGHPPSQLVPSLGVDGHAVLAELGVSPDTIERLTASGVVATATIDPARVGYVDPIPPHLSHLVRSGAV